MSAASNQLLPFRPDSIGSIGPRARRSLDNEEATRSEEARRLDREDRNAGSEKRILSVWAAKTPAPLRANELCAHETERPGGASPADAVAAQILLSKLVGSKLTTRMGALGRSAPRAPATPTPRKSFPMMLGTHRERWTGRRPLWRRVCTRSMRSADCGSPSTGRRG